MSATSPSRTASSLRQLFLDFFRRHGHTVVASSPLVPQDPTLLFTNAGMVQFKDVFTGKQSLGFTRAASSQKCVRAGGKHNDLDNVGRTARHHTFFEMLGNFSFGDYFKEQAISLAWELLHKELALPKERLLFTVFRGEDGIPADDQARALWRRIAEVPDDRVIGLGKKDNFWMMGETGPQGPCSEIHFHQGEGLPCATEAATGKCLGVACECDRWLEIWNLVFMQFERKHEGGPLLPLPAPSIDTGAGLERLTAVVQGKRSNYDTDLFTPLLEKVSHACQRPYLHGDSDDDVSMRVLADHCRATAFLMADGVLPSNLGRGYVMRSIMRRAIRHAVRLSLPAGFFATLCGSVTDLMGEAFPELRGARSLIDKAVNAEDEGFRATIDRGLKLIADTQWEKASGQRTMPGRVAFQLHDTFGFPLDLTQVIGREQGFAVDTDGFAAEMQKQRDLSKATTFKSGDEAVGDIYKTLRGSVGATVFTGYGTSSADPGTSGSGKILALVLLKGDQAGERPLGSVASAGEGQQVDVIVDRTPFYARSGGQAGDTGRIVGPAGEMTVLDTWKPVGDLHVQRGKILSGTLSVGDELRLEVDSDKRNATRRNHSATHLLHHALRAVLGEHVTQKGSYVGPDKLTFDFSHFAQLTRDERQRVERLVNEAILRNVDQQVVETGMEQARALGALALFGEKYGDKVRVMRLGSSVELCGGTHVFRTGDIGLFKITSVEGLAQGVRRVTALTGTGALELVEKMEGELTQAAELLRAGPLEIAERVAKLQDDLKGREKDIAALKQKALLGGGGGLFSEERVVGGEKIVARRLPDADMKALRDVADGMLGKLGAGVLVLGGVSDGKVALVVAVRKDLAQAGKWNAGKIIARLAALVGGKGGGKPEMAQAGGSQPDKLDEALGQSFALLES